MDGCFFFPLYTSIHTHQQGSGIQQRLFFGLCLLLWQYFSVLNVLWPWNCLHYKLLCTKKKNRKHKVDEQVQDISASTWVVGWLVGWRVGDVGHRVDWDGKAGIMLLCPDWPRSAFCLVHVTTGLLCSPCYNYHQSQSDLLRWSLKLKAYYTFLYKNAHLLLFHSLPIPTSGQKRGKEETVVKVCGQRHKAGSARPKFMEGQLRASSNPFTMNVSDKITKLANDTITAGSGQCSPRALLLRKKSESFFWCSKQLSLLTPNYSLSDMFPNARALSLQTDHYIANRGTVGRCFSVLP